uniref:Uncharacterized protein n=1 Tax=Setaria italica TaxID=4555 RepID=K3Z1C6_SETIT
MPTTWIETSLCDKINTEPQRPEQCSYRSCLSMACHTLSASF